MSDDRGRGRHKPKHRKRPRGWHRGKGEARRWAQVERELPDVDSGADPTTGAPKPVRKSWPNRGDAA